MEVHFVSHLVFATQIILIRVIGCSVKHAWNWGKSGLRMRQWRSGGGRGWGGAHEEEL